MKPLLVSEGPEIYQVKVPYRNISTSATNCYIVKDGDESLIIDTGAPSEEGRTLFLQTLADLDIDREKATYFLTHLHLDHAGLVSQVVPRGAKLLVSKKDFTFTRTPLAEQFAKALYNMLIKEGVPESEAYECERLQRQAQLFEVQDYNLAFVGEGDHIKVGRFDFEVIDTSGHTPGHLSLYQRQSKQFIGGDHLLFVISPSIEPATDGSDSFKVHLANLEKIKLLEVDRVLCAHGAIQGNPYERIDWLIAHHKRRLEETLKIIAHTPGLTGYQIIRSIKWNVPFDSWEEISLLQRACIIREGMVIVLHLKEGGHIERIEGKDSLIRYRIKQNQASSTM